MTTVLENHIARAQHGVGPAVAEDMIGRSNRTYYRAQAEAWPYIRIVYVGRLKGDGRVTAVAFMHDGSARGTTPSGPAWAMSQGDAAARFIPDAKGVI